MTIRVISTPEGGIDERRVVELDELGNLACIVEYRNVAVLVVITIADDGSGVTATLTAQKVALGGELIEDKDDLPILHFGKKRIEEILDHLAAGVAESGGVAPVDSLECIDNEIFVSVTYA